ncbi:MAG: hypothetical protein K0B87_00795 [Candidatus Syntrophosphaera sp.]|nr:hypothetical protein [Candidatus Syntrophosphaera sp.]
MKYTLLAIILLAIASLAFGQAQIGSKFSLDLETGAAFSGYNDLRIPNAPEDNSTMFSFTDDLSSKTVMYGRANLHYKITPRHQVSLLAAPLTIRPTGTLDYNVEFMGETFTAGKKIDAVYRFNSFRLQYLYRFKNQNIGIRAIGLSGKVRDAVISLENEDGYAEKTDLGFVPLIGFEFGYDFTNELSVILKGEALASPFGRAEDVLLAFNYDFNDRYGLYLGYRFLEGGSDIDEVYTFANVNYAAIGTRIRF